MSAETEPDLRLGFPSVGPPPRAPNAGPRCPAGRGPSASPPPGEEAGGGHTLPPQGPEMGETENGGAVITVARGAAVRGEPRKNEVLPVCFQWGFFSLLDLATAPWPPRPRQTVAPQGTLSRGSAPAGPHPPNSRL